jgi:dipeptidyl aminopeptidase/acylaminoacyl peptidase
VTPSVRSVILLLVALAAPAAGAFPVRAEAQAQAPVTRADYQRAQGLSDRYEPLAVNVPDAATWAGKTHRFYYNRSTKDGHEFIVVDADTLKKAPAFDHARLAAALSKTAEASYTAARLPFTAFTLNDEGDRMTMQIDGVRWSCTLSDYACRRPEPPPPMVNGAVRRGISGPVRASDAAISPRVKLSPDGAWEAAVQNYNVIVRALKPARAKAPVVLSTDGSEGNYYDVASIVWSPDSKRLAAYRVKPGYVRLVHYIQSSPEDQVQPKHWALQYAKPGDVLDVEQPVLFDVAAARQIPVASDLFPNAFELSDLVWRKDSRAVTFEYNQRGHQVYRVIEVAADSGNARAVISEEPKTFFYYSGANASLSSGKRFRHDVADGREVIWMSERDGWNQLYLVDGATGAVKNQITRGAWPVRSVEKVDEEKRQIWFSAGGMTPGRDPYFLQYYRINFDGSGLMPLTTADADHLVKFSADMTLFVDTYSRVDLAPVSELRRAADGSLVAEIDRGDIRALQAAGWKPPEPFVAKGRDGVTDIYGVIFRPTNFDPSKTYPVIESIYAGPHGSFVPKSFSAFNPMQAQAEIGAIVVQIDGMGTSNRSKAFQDVAWQDIKDAGFPDRILWHKAVAAKYPWYDISRVGIYGGSAGGQNAMGALLFHPEFYKVAVAYAGCHDNRMDKIWWNEQWMGWPIGPQYAASSNVDSAARLQGKLLLVVGELDTNVDPASTMQVVHALLKANKTFDLLVVPGADHGAGRRDEYAAYGERKRFDFFVQHLMNQTPPDWNTESTHTAP